MPQSVVNATFFGKSRIGERRAVLARAIHEILLLLGNDRILRQRLFAFYFYDGGGGGGGRKGAAMRRG